MLTLTTSACVFWLPLCAVVSCAYCQVVGPRLRFDCEQVDVGIVPFGFPTVRDVTLFNDCEVPQLFKSFVRLDESVFCLLSPVFAASSSIFSPSPSPPHVP